MQSIFFIFVKNQINMSEIKEIDFIYNVAKLDDELKSLLLSIDSSAINLTGEAILIKYNDIHCSLNIDIEPEINRKLSVQIKRVQIENIDDGHKEIVDCKLYKLIQKLVHYENSSNTR